MNESHIEQIFNNYAEKFDLLNGPVHKEYFKWQIAKRFRPMMDEALSVSAADLPSALSKLQKLTVWLIDNSRIQPFNGLVQYSKREPETVRTMFHDLFAGGGALPDRVYNFLTESHALRDRYYPGSFRYTNDVHSTTAYLAMYDPDHNYVFKASHALKFADCVDFYDDWGSGDTVKLDVYYRMCDQLVEAINSSEALLATDARRFSGELGVSPDTLHEDPQKHILAFDLIYCCSTYNLFDGISFSKRSPSERQASKERQREAAEKYEKLTEELDALEDKLRAFEGTKSYLAEIFSIGSTVRHRVFGCGQVTDVSSESGGPLITVDFPTVGRKRIDLCMAVKNSIILADDDKFSTIIESHKTCLELFDHTKLETLERSIKTTEQAIEALGKIQR